MGPPSNVSRWIHISGSRQGAEKRDNRDSLFVREAYADSGERLLLAGVADGVGTHYFGGAVARWFCAYMRESVLPIQSCRTVADDARSIVEDAARAYAKDMTARSDDYALSSATISFGVITENALHAFWAGDSPILLSSMSGSGYQTRRLSVPDVDPAGHLTDCFGVNLPRTLKRFEAPLKDGAIVTFATDGFCEQWDDSALSNAYREISFGKSLSKRLLAPPFRDDATFVALKLQ